MPDDRYPYTIENGAGERLAFLRLVPDPAGDRLEVQNLVKPGAGPPMHATTTSRKPVPPARDGPVFGAVSKPQPGELGHPGTSG